MANVIIAGNSGVRGVQATFEIQLNTMGHDVFSISLPDETDTSLETVFRHPSFPKDIDLIILESDAHGNAGIPAIRGIAEKVFGEVPPILAYSAAGNHRHESKFLAEGATEAWIIWMNRSVTETFREKVLKYIPQIPDKEGQTYLAAPEGLRLDI